ncbi:MAG: hypothetical protein JSS67_09295 [Bacteroidetes bacterium]|nr:hypothetical protein [Bacteroidota bacterium]
MKKQIPVSLQWGILHGINDWISGYLLMHFSLSNPGKESITALVLYVILAFGGQLPLGLLVDRWKTLKVFGQLSILLLMIATIFSIHFIFTAIIIAGIASAGIHVIGGTICLQQSENKLTPLGIFTAPGVAGLAFGGFCGMLSTEWILLPLSFIFLLFWHINKKGWPVYIKKNHPLSNLPGAHDLAMILILLLMTVRSFIFDMINQFSVQMEYGLIILGLSAFLGKIIGAVIADKIGWKNWLYISLPLAFFFCEIGRNNIWALGFGVACLQSSVPLTLQMMYTALPEYPATSAAMSLGTVIALAGLPIYSLPEIHGAFAQSKEYYYSLVIVLFVLIAFLFWMYFKKNHQQVTES